MAGDKKEYTYRSEDKEGGIIVTWFYDTEVRMNPTRVVIEHTEAYVDLVVANELLPKTRRKYFNPANGKMISYARARALNLLK